MDSTRYPRFRFCHFHNMKTPLWLLLLSFFLQGCRRPASSSNTTEENWVYFPYAKEGAQAFNFVNAGLFESISKAPRSLAVLCLTFKLPDQYGLPTNTEHEAAVVVEDQIDRQAALSKDWFVGRVTISSQRHFYVYTHQEPTVWEGFAAKLAKDSGYEITVSFRDDPQHEGYLKDLYPNEDDWQVIGDSNIISALAKEGDNGAASRTIEHWLCFPDQASAEPFIAWAQQDRFFLDPKLTRLNEKGGYAVKLTHHGTIKLADITSHTVALRRKAAEHGGQYDGWETEVRASASKSDAIE